MPKEISQIFARRARLSSKAIVTAIALTLAALIASAIALRQETKTTEKEVRVDSVVPDTPGSMLVPVVNR